MLRNARVGFRLFVDKVVDTIDPIIYPAHYSGITDPKNREKKETGR